MLNITVSHKSLIRLLDNIGKDYDTEVKVWRDRILLTLDDDNDMVINLSICTYNSIQIFIA